MKVVREPVAPDSLVDVVPFFKVFCNSTRAQIIDFLLRGERCVCEMTGPLDQSQPLVSHHLALLRDAGIVRMRSEGCAHLLLHRLGAVRRRAQGLPRLRRSAAQRTARRRRHAAAPVRSAAKPAKKRNAS